MAERLGVGKDVVSRWANGKRKPDPQQRATIEDKIRIPWRAWDIHTASPTAEAPSPSPDPHDGKAA